MGLRAETREELRKESVTKIFGQPTDQDITLLEKELIAIAASIPTSLGGGAHGHAGLIVEATKYTTMTGGTNPDAAFGIVLSLRAAINIVQSRISSI